jgi:hypothetical protein
MLSGAALRVRLLSVIPVSCPMEDSAKLRHPHRQIHPVDCGLDLGIEATTTRSAGIPGSCTVGASRVRPRLGLLGRFGVWVYVGRAGE